MVQCLKPPTSESCEVTLTNWYETTALASIAPNERYLDHSPFARGLFAGVMALVYKAHVHEERLTFDGQLYRRLFGEGRAYQGEFIRSRLRGEGTDVVRLYG